MSGSQPEDSLGDIPSSLRLYSVSQVAKILQVGENTVRKFIFEGKLRAWRVGVYIRIPQSAVEAFVEESPCIKPDTRRGPRRKASGGGPALG